MKHKLNEQVDCVMCGYCCGYRRETEFGGASYAENEPIPEGIKVKKTDEGYTILVDEDDTCIYLEKLDNGFARCSIHDKRPKMCKLFYCLTQQKARQLQTIVDELWQHQH
jgi:Fe-S-cluster containining protein